MNQLIYPFLVLILKWMEPQYNARMRFLEFQIQILRSRSVPSMEERYGLGEWSLESIAPEALS